MKRQTREQTRALFTYQCVERVLGESDQKQSDYKILVNGFGANVMRSGLVAAIAFLERERSRSQAFLDDLYLALKEVKNPCIKGDSDLPSEVRDLGVEDYMLLTREILEIAQWFKRAVQARL